MFAIFALIAFILALIFHIAGGSVNQYVIDAELLGFIFLAAYFCIPFGIPAGWTRRPPG